MGNRRWKRRGIYISTAGALALSGCLFRTPAVPRGYLPQSSNSPDAQTTARLTPDSTPKMNPPQPPESVPAKGPPPFQLPTSLPGMEATPIRPPKFNKQTPPAERLRLVREAYPDLTPAGGLEKPAGEPLTLADLQQLARASSPVLRRAASETGVAYGQVVQAGLPPNPTAGYQADQWQPGPDPNKHNAGQQGAYVNQLIKFPGKLSLAQAIARFDYVNAFVAYRRAEVDVSTAVRANYFQVLLAKKSIEVNESMARLADEVYQIQLKQMAAGEAAGYEPLQLYAQAIQTRNALVQAQASYRANWRQLTASLGQPDLPLTPLAGSVDLSPPSIDVESARLWIAEAHTDILTARNRLLQSQTNLKLQRLNRYPDLATNAVFQYDHAAKNPQFNIQLGIPLPLWDRNQGNIRSAQYQIASNTQTITATQNELLSRLADALGRYDSNRVVVANYRDKVLPALTQAYQGVIRRYQQEPVDVPGGKVSFNDIVVAQQNLAQALQGYMTALGGQWQAVIDLANLLQVDELYAVPSMTPPAPPKK